ncbi:MAG: hypothetical protein ACM3Q1_15305 [Bacteroidales bacterium]
MLIRIMGAFTFAAVLSASAAFAEEHSHSHAAAGTVAPAAAKVATDAALRQGMEDIRATMASGLAKRPGPADYPRLADAVEAGIDRITQTCKLDPDADARLHLLLARMIDGVGRLRGADKQQVGVALILGALDEYGRTFDHPGWVGFGH